MIVYPKQHKTDMDKIEKIRQEIKRRIAKRVECVKLEGNHTRAIDGSVTVELMSLLSFLDTLQVPENTPFWKKVHVYEEPLKEGDMEKMLLDLSVSKGEKRTNIALPDRVVNALQEQDMGEVSDGYHTFNELYYYRMLYNAAFFNLLPKEWVHKSKRHHTGEECFGGEWFVVMANLPTGQISNHYELKDWDLFHIPEKEFADKWDGHTPEEAAERLHKYLTLQETEVDLEKELDAWRHNHFKGKRDGHYSGEYLERTSQLDLARYFFELRKNAK